MGQKETSVQKRIIARLSVRPDVEWFSLPDKVTGAAAHRWCRDSANRFADKVARRAPQHTFWLTRKNTGGARLDGASNGGKRGVRFGTPGEADICGTLAYFIVLPTGHAGPFGLHVEIEVKTEDAKSKPSVAQVARHNLITSAGGIYILARSADDATQQLDWEIDALAERCRPLFTLQQETPQ